MRYKLILLASMMMLMMAGFATPSMGQITVSVKDKPLTEVMPLAEKQGGFRSFYTNTLRKLGGDKRP